MTTRPALRHDEWTDDAAGLIVRRIVVGALDTNCWILACRATGRAVLVDPGDEPGRIISAADDLDVQAVVLTHSHWDHVLGLPEVADHFGVDVLMHAEDAPVWPHELDHLECHGHFDAGTATSALLAANRTPRQDSTRHVWDGATRHIDPDRPLEIGRLTLDVLHTPGHTPGGISLVVGTHAFTGDTLFPGGPGLTGWPLSDFPTIMSSVRRLLTLPASTLLHPGHGPSTTVAIERPHVDEWAARGW